MGLQLRKTHRVLGFKQKAFLKPYVEHKSKKAEKEDNKVKKKKTKLKKQRIFCKSLENSMNKVDVKIDH